MTFNKVEKIIVSVNFIETSMYVRLEYNILNSTINVEIDLFDHLISIKS